MNFVITWLFLGMFVVVYLFWKIVDGRIEFDLLLFPSLVEYYKKQGCKTWVSVMLSAMVGVFAAPFILMWYVAVFIFIVVLITIILFSTDKKQ